MLTDAHKIKPKNISVLINAELPTLLAKIPSKAEKISSVISQLNAQFQ